MAPKKQGSTHWVVVLGDFGRSPRMQYHTLSLAREQNTQVHVLAYGGSNPIAELRNAPNVQIRSISEPPAWMRKLPRLLFLLLKVLLQMMQLLWAMLVALPRPASILMQNPPAIPTMALCWLAAKRHGACLVIDWHNFGYTIMALSSRPGHWLVRLARSYERFWGRRAARGFCVTHAMQQELQADWGVNAVVLYDRPPSFFQRTDLPTAHDLFTRLAPSLIDTSSTDCLANGWQREALKQSDSNSPVSSPVTKSDAGGKVSWQPGRPAIVVSSTSWTPDEDFGVLLEAAKQYDAHASQPQHAALLPDILFLITGKGPQKEVYLAKLRAMKFARVAFRTLWLEPSDYPRLLGASDVGVSLHASSSGLDLPMKVVDMFGSGLPVCALSYSCIHELVSDGETGLLFTSPQQLSEQLVQLLTGFSSDGPNPLLRKLQKGVATKEQSLRWDANWKKVAWPQLRP